MSNQNKISAVIITFNEEKNIERCLRSLESVADEIIVVDSFSTDNTEEICLKHKVKFIKNTFEGHIQQKNFAKEQAKYDYVLSLDADEALSDTLKINILKEKQYLKYDAYSFKRLNNYCGKWIKHCGWYPDIKIRLWNKNKGNWGGLNPHDKVILKKNTSLKKIKGDLLHYSYYTIDEHIAQNEKFSSIRAEVDFNRGKKSNIFLITIKPIIKFIKSYIFQFGFLDGRYGFIISWNMAKEKHLRFLKLKKLWDSHKA